MAAADLKRRTFLGMLVIQGMRGVQRQQKEMG
jgi:hypothetical protein